MPLLEIPISFESTPIPVHLSALVTDAMAASAAFDRQTGSDRIPDLVTSSPEIIWGFLTEMRRLVPDCGQTFCEWGSGLGIVTCLADALGWTAHGLEIEPRLIATAKQLAAKHNRSVQFDVSSYKQDGLFEGKIDPADLDTGKGFGLLDFDVIYGYLWNAEYQAVTQLVSDHGRPGTLFLRYGGGLDFKIFRVVAPNG